MLVCTICGQPADFARLQIHIAQGTATYLLCGRLACIRTATDRATENLLTAASQPPPRVARGRRLIEARAIELDPDQMASGVDNELVPRPLED